MNTPLNAPPDIETVEPREAEAEPWDLTSIRYERRLIQVAAIGFLVLIVWSALFTLDIATMAMGEVAPADQVQKVQHLEGGIVRKIHVREGQKVRKGDALVELEGVAVQTDKQELEARIASLRIRILRLEAVIGRKRSLVFPPEVVKDFPNQVEEARQLFQAQLERSNSNRDSQSWKIVQRKEELSELKARLEHLTEQRRVLREQVRIDKQLLDKGIGNQYEYLQRTREDASFTGQISETQASLRRVEAAQQQEQSGLASITAGDSEDNRKDLEESRKQLAEFVKRMEKFTDSTARAVIRSPVDGTVLTLYTVTQGGVVSPGAMVVSLVPGNEHLVIEAKLNAGDVGLVTSNQKVRLRLESSSGRRFQPIDGKVVHISPDAITEPQKPPYFMVRIVPQQSAFDDGTMQYKLSPGVQVSASIITGHRSVLQYLLDPLLGRYRGGLTEP